jgi:hypothetical protein
MAVSQQTITRSLACQLSFFNSHLSSEKRKFNRYKTHVAQGKPYNALVKYASQCVIPATAVSRCTETFRHYPQGVNRAAQTQRLRKLVALGWLLGMSLRGIWAAFLLTGSGVSW